MKRSKSKNKKTNFIARKKREYLKFEDLGVIRRAALRLLPHVIDPEGNDKIKLSKIKSSRNFEFIDDYTVTLDGGYRLCRASRYIPIDRKYYWEFDYLSGNDLSHVRVGIANIQADMEGPVGIDIYGYSVRDLGNAYHDGHRNKIVVTPEYKVGDTVGFGFIPLDDSCALQLFINGKNIGIIYNDVDIELYWTPAISIYKKAVVGARFGRPFKYDPGPKWKALDEIPPENEEGIDPTHLISVMKGEVDIDDNLYEELYDAMDSALIPAHLMPI